MDTNTSNTPVLTKEQVLDAQYKGKQYSALKDKEVFVAMEEYARLTAIEFAKFRQQYQEGEAFYVRKICPGISWIGLPDGKIYDEYLLSKNFPFTHRGKIQFDIITERGPGKCEGRTMQISFEKEQALVEYFNTETKQFEYKIFPFSKLYPEQNKKG